MRKNWRLLVLVLSVKLNPRRLKEIFNSLMEQVHFTPCSLVNLEALGLKCPLCKFFKAGLKTIFCKFSSTLPQHGLSIIHTERTKAKMDKKDSKGQSGEGFAIFLQNRRINAVTSVHGLCFLTSFLLLLIHNLLQFRTR